MRDFTLSRYREYLHALNNANYQFMRFRDALVGGEIPQGACLIRHDVDRKPYNALCMAQLERELGICSTYYFRTKNCSFDEHMIQEIESLGHEIGYHYEDLADSGGCMKTALQSFESNLASLRCLAEITTVSAHGRPLSRFDSRDMWLDEQRRSDTFKRLNLLGEIYLDLEYKGVAYINDTGRNWSSTQSNLRDRVASDIDTDVSDSRQLEDLFLHKTFDRVVFQTHPERWAHNMFDWTTQIVLDSFVNVVKSFIVRVR